MIQTITQGVATEIGITLLDSSNNAVIGVLYSALTVQYRKNGGAFVNKVVTSGEWNEVGDGVYKLTFSAAELDVEGFFRILVSGSSFVTYRTDLILVNDYLTVAEQVIGIKQDLAGKVNIADAVTLFEQVEVRLKTAEQRVADLETRLQRALGALQASKNQL